MRRWLGVVIAGLYLLSIPWYRSSGAEPRIVLGLPDWVAVALGCYLAIAVLNAFAWLRRDASAAEPAAPAGSRPPSTSSAGVREDR